MYYCTGGNNGDSPTNLSLSDVQTVVASLMSADGNMILESQIGEDRFGTAPVPDAYVAFGHTDLSKPLSNLNGFTSKWNYPLMQGVLKSSINNKEVLQIEFIG
jgi:hypothetical protein